MHPMVIRILKRKFNPQQRFQHNPQQRFQHNSHIIITKKTCEYVRAYKTELMKETAVLMDLLKIPYVIANGNLIEYERGVRIYHDDDIDIRLDYKMLDTFISYINSNDTIIHLTKLQDGWYQGRLRHFSNPLSLNMDIHIDIVENTIEYSPWIKYDIGYSNRRSITYLGIETYAPSAEDTERVLTIEYGVSWRVPNYTPYEPK